jgi:formylglycine-generating enzyme required for sulfatase activity
MEHEVTVRAFAAFVRDNPEWAPERRAMLKAAGLVDDRYLMDWPADWSGIVEGDASSELRRLGAMPVRYISWHAAAAYAEWFSREVEGTTFPGIDGRPRVSLPEMAGWEYAAFLDSLGPATRVVESDEPSPAQDGVAGALGLLHMRGNLWEWTADWYAENVPILPAPVASQRAVIGGSYVNPLLPLGTVGSQPPEWCTPFLGFRLAVYGSESGIYD